MDWDEFEKLRLFPMGIIQPYNNQTRWFLDLTHEYNKVDPEANDFSIEIFKKYPDVGFPTDDFSLNKLLSSGLDTDQFGHMYFNLKSLLAWKKQ